jgi:hypothetical protein
MTSMSVSEPSAVVRTSRTMGSSSTMMMRVVRGLNAS